MEYVCMISLLTEQTAPHTIARQSATVLRSHQQLLLAAASLESFDRLIHEAFIFHPCLMWRYTML